MKQELLRKSNPVLIDAFLEKLQDTLKDNVVWLDKVYGRSFKHTRLKDNKSYNYPAIYIGDNEYLSMLPDDTASSLLFFELADPQDIDVQEPGKLKLNFKGAIIVWYNSEDVFSDNYFMYTEEVKSDLLEVLTQKGNLGIGCVTPLSVFESPESIYKGYDLKQIDEQYLMHPYYGVRIECQFTIFKLC